jgi:hypothetical protein
MNNFNEMVSNIKEFNSPIDDYDNLSKFFQVFEKFNHGKPIDESIKSKIEIHMKYKWECDKIQAFLIEDDLKSF